MMAWSRRGGLVVIVTLCRPLCQCSFSVGANSSSRQSVQLYDRELRVSTRETWLVRYFDRRDLSRRHRGILAGAPSPPSWAQPAPLARTEPRRSATARGPSTSSYSSSSQTDPTLGPATSMRHRSAVSYVVRECCHWSAGTRLGESTVLTHRDALAGCSPTIITREPRPGKLRPRRRQRPRSVIRPVTSIRC
jgi:hypothetical protein